MRSGPHLRLLLGVAGVFFTLLLLPPASAAADVTLTVSPVRLDRVARPGERVEIRVQIRNGGTEVGDVRARATDVSVNDTSGAVTLGAPTQLSMTSWMTLTPDRFQLGPGQAQDVRLLVAVPENALPGVRLGAVSFSTVGDAIPNRVSFAGEVSSVLSLRVRNTISDANPASADPALLVIAPRTPLTIDLSTPVISLGWPVGMTATVRNAGGDVVDSRAVVSVFGPFGREDQQIQFGDGQVLPGGARSLEANAGGEFYSVGPYLFVPQVRGLGSNELAVGPARVVWIVPILPLLGALGVVVVLGIIFWAGRSTRTGAGAPGGSAPPRPAPRPAASPPRVRSGTLPPGATAGPAIGLVNPEYRPTADDPEAEPRA